MIISELNDIRLGEEIFFIETYEENLPYSGPTSKVDENNVWWKIKLPVKIIMKPIKIKLVSIVTSVCMGEVPEYIDEEFIETRYVFDGGDRYYEFNRYNQKLLFSSKEEAVEHFSKTSSQVVLYDEKNDYYYYEKYKGHSK